MTYLKSLLLLLTVLILGSGSAQTTLTWWDYYVDGTTNEVMNKLTSVLTKPPIPTSPSNALQLALET